MTQERMKEGSMCSRDSQAQAGKINKVQGERQGWALYPDCRCMNLYKPQVLFAVHIYIANIQYIMCSRYATPIHHTTHSHSPRNVLRSRSSQFHHLWLVCQAKMHTCAGTTALRMKNKRCPARSCQKNRVQQLAMQQYVAEQFNSITKTAQYRVSSHYE